MTDYQRAAVIIDYQNLHLTGHGLFAPHEGKHEVLVHPGLYARKLIQVRNAAQREGHPSAKLSRILVYRGLPSAELDPDPYAWNQAQKSEWEKDPLVQVSHRPLKYKFQYTKDGFRATDSANRYIVAGREEKGVDVLCALALVRESLKDDIDVVILASQDSDLSHALDEVLDYGQAKAETASWFKPKEFRRSKEIRPTNGRRVWNTRMNESAFIAVRDTKVYD